jgi:hypothetical protein
MNTPIVADNNRTKTRADEAAERYRQAAPARPIRPGLLAGLWARLRPYLLTAAVSLALGGAMVGSLSYLTMPIVATEVERVFVDVNGDGAPDFLVSGFVVFAPKAAGQ